MTDYHPDQSFHEYADGDIAYKAEFEKSLESSRIM